MTQRDGTEREVGGGFRMGNTCIPMTHSIAGVANNQKKAKGRGHWLVVQWPTICLPTQRTQV